MLVIYVIAQLVSAFVSDNAVRCPNINLLNDEGQHLQFKFDMVRNATTRIFLNSYLFALPKDEMEELKNVLIEKADQGLDVTLMYDLRGTKAYLGNNYKVLSESIEALKKHGVKVKEFKSVAGAWLTNHAKHWLVDEFISMGGFNLDKGGNVLDIDVVFKCGKKCKKVSNTNIN